MDRMTHFYSVPERGVNPFRQLSTALAAQAATGQPVVIQPQGRVKASGQIDTARKRRAQLIVKELQRQGRHTEVKPGWNVKEFGEFVPSGTLE